ncbi:MAG: putative rane protein [Solirubrobacterales bacterium]|nr:putative rane protein [Solirubrobacterales bacterium]
MATTTYPGVYIEEFAPGAPIAGVGTSTGAFIGPAARGDVNTAIKLTSWDEFKAKLGADPLDGFYLWYAVRGFFENGGTVCYVVRATTGDYDRATLPDQNGTPTLVVRAKALGDNSASPIKVSATKASAAVSGAKLFKPRKPRIVAASGTQITVDDAAKAADYRPGDLITWTNTAEPKPSTVIRVAGTTITVAEPVSQTYATETIKLAAAVPGTTAAVRIGDPTGTQIGAGSILHLKQGAMEENVVVRRVSAERSSPTLTTYRLDLRTAVTKAYDLSADVAVDSFEFGLQIKHGTTVWPYAKLSMDPLHPRYFADVIAADPTAIVVAAPATPPSTSVPPLNQPNDTAGDVNLTGGADDHPAQLTATHYANALEVLEAVDDVNLVAAPDSQDAAVQQELIAHCELTMDRFAVLDSKQGLDLFGATSVETQRNALESVNGYAALYYPWLVVPPASGTKTILVPPSGHIAGICARTDERRGVHKAPAGEEATVNGAIGVERTMSDVAQGQLNMEGINVVRVFKPGGRPVVWGARTTAPKGSNWTYVSLRRLFEYLEESIQEGIRWAVFEPNNLELWQKLKRTITDFLTRAWRDGALFGETAERAFYVRIDEALNPFSEQQLGRLHIEIGCRPSYPAEFIVVRIGIWDGGGAVTEA